MESIDHFITRFFNFIFNYLLVNRFYFPEGSLAFFQVNHQQAELMIEIVKDFARLGRSDLSGLRLGAARCRPRPHCPGHPAHGRILARDPTPLRLLP